MGEFGILIKNNKCHVEEKKNVFLFHRQTFYFKGSILLHPSLLYIKLRTKFTVQSAELTGQNSAMHFASPPLPPLRGRGGGEIPSPFSLLLHYLIFSSSQQTTPWRGLTWFKKKLCLIFLFFSFVCHILRKTVSILPHCKEDEIYVFPEMKLHGLSPNSDFHVSVSDLHIPMIGPHIFCSNIGWPLLKIL